MADVVYEKVVFSDYEEYDSKFKKWKSQTQIWSWKTKKKIEPNPVNYIILDPICTTFDPEESLKLLTI